MKNKLCKSLAVVIATALFATSVTIPQKTVYADDTVVNEESTSEQTTTEQTTTEDETESKDANTTQDTQSNDVSDNGTGIITQEGTLENGDKITVNQPLCTDNDGTGYWNSSSKVNTDPEEDNINTATTLPTAYNSLSKGLVTSVKDQNPYGTCWAFASSASAESTSIYKKLYTLTTADFAEAQHAYFVYNTVTDPLGGTTGDKTEIGQRYSSSRNYLSMGGNEYLSTGAYANWVGPTNESNMPYSSATPSSTFSSTLAYSKDAVHLRDALFLAMTSRKSIKSLLMTYGTANVSYYYDYSYESSDGSKYYCNDTDLEGYTNHAVTLVGWDDSYSKSNFDITPPGDGAWIIKNSWGDYNATDGYFYISYYDTTLSTSQAIFNIMDSAKNFDNNYQYDGTYDTSSYLSTSANQVYMANVFKADSTELLKAVSFYTKDPSTQYQIKIYKNVSGTTSPTSGTLAYTSSVATMKYAGYHTVDLTTGLSLAKGEKYSVVVELIKPSSQSSINFACEYGIDSYYCFFKSTVGVSAGQSFISTDGSSYTDITNIGVDDVGNLRIKAFTKEIVKGKATSFKSVSSTAYNKIKLQWYEAPGATSYKIYRSASASGTYSLIYTTANGSTLTYTDTVSIVGKPFYYKVVANYSGTLSAYSAAKGTCTSPNNVATFTACKNSDTSVILRYKQPAGATGYVIQKKNASGTYVTIATVTPGTKLSYYDKSSIVAGRTYLYRIKAFTNYNGNKVYSSDYKYAQVIMPPTSVTLRAAASTSAGRITVMWNAAKGAAGYKIYRSTSSNGTYSLVGTVDSTKTTFTDKGLTSGKTYYYKVKLYTMNGNTEVLSAFSAVKYAKAQ